MLGDLLRSGNNEEHRVQNLSGLTQAKTLHPDTVTAFQWETLGGSEKSSLVTLPDGDLTMVLHWWLGHKRPGTNDRNWQRLALGQWVPDKQH